MPELDDDMVKDSTEFDNNVVAVLSSSVVNCLNSYILLSESVKLLVDILISYRIDNFFNFYTLIVLNFNLRL